MRNPLNRRILRELRSDFGKYSVIFLFMILTIGFVSGDLVASHSMLATYDESYQKYNIENFDGACFLCSEETPEQCHRRLLVEYFKELYPTNINIVHIK